MATLWSATSIGKRVHQELRTSLRFTTEGYFCFQVRMESEVYKKPDLACGRTCTECRVKMQKRVPGKTEFGTFFMGQRYHFPGSDQMKMFNTNPNKYVEK